MTYSKKNIPSLTGKVAIVTGGNSGLGYYTVKYLAEAGAKVVMTCRDLAKGYKAAQSIDGDVDVRQLDLEFFESIENFTKGIVRDYKHLDILINNAGIMIPPFALATCGVERQLAVNHLGHFKLVYHLLPLLRTTSGARVVAVSSLAHRKGVLNLDDVNYKHGELYEPMVAYRRSKLANLLFMYGLQYFFEEHGIDCISLAAHPGVSPTNIVNHRLSLGLRLLLRPFANFFLQRPVIGALAQVRAAVDPEMSGGQFLGPSSPNEWRGRPIYVSPNVELVSAKSIKELWDFSEKVCKVKYS